MNSRRPTRSLAALVVLTSSLWAEPSGTAVPTFHFLRPQSFLSGKIEPVSSVEELVKCASQGGFKTCEIVKTLRGTNPSGNMIDYALPEGQHDLTVRCAPGVKVEWRPSRTPTGYVKIWHVDMTKAAAGSRHRLQNCVVEEIGGGTTAVAGVVYTNTEQNPARQTVFRIEDSRITIRSVGEANGQSTYEAACGTGRDDSVNQGVTRVEIVDSECTARAIALSLFNDCSPECLDNGIRSIVEDSVLRVEAGGYCVGGQSRGTPCTGDTQAEADAQCSGGGRCDLAETPAVLYFGQKSSFQWNGGEGYHGAIRSVDVPRDEQQTGSIANVTLSHVPGLRGDGGVSAIFDAPPGPSGGNILLDSLRLIADGTAPTPHVFFNWDFGQLLGDVFVDVTHARQVSGPCFGLSRCGVPLFNVGGTGDSYWVDTSTALFPIALTIRGPEPHRPATLLGPNAVAAPLSIGPGYIDGGSRDYVTFNLDGDRSSGICARELWAEGNPTESQETEDYLDFENHDMGPVRGNEEMFRIFSTTEVHGLQCEVDTAPGPGSQWEMRVLVDGLKLPGTMLAFEGLSESTSGVNDVACTIAGLEKSCTSGFEGGVTDQGEARLTVSVDSSGGENTPHAAGRMRCSFCLGRAKPRI